MGLGSRRPEGRSRLEAGLSREFLGSHAQGRVPQGHHIFEGVSPALRAASYRFMAAFLEAAEPQALHRPEEPSTEADAVLTLGAVGRGPGRKRHVRSGHGTMLGVHLASSR
jgi:hypothetical protein